jgi:uncharacterized ion transporter superfamily protein YfcC
MSLASEMARTFVNGAKDVMNVTLIIAVGRPILIILNESYALDTVLKSVATVISASKSLFLQHQNDIMPSFKIAGLK